MYGVGVCETAMDFDTFVIEVEPCTWVGLECVDLLLYVCCGCIPIEVSFVFLYFMGVGYTVCGLWFW